MKKAYVAFHHMNTFFRMYSLHRLSPVILIASLAFAAGCSPSASRERLWTLDELEVEVTDTTREVAYTNGAAGFYYTESNAPQRNGWQGWHSMSVRILDDYQVAIDGKPLDRSSVHLARVWPHQFTRAYPQGVQESVTLLDSVDALVVEFDNISGDGFTAAPLFSEADTSQYIIVERDGALLVALRRHLHRTPREDFPVWIGMTVAGGSSIRRGDGVRNGRHFAPASLDASLSEDKATLLFVAGDTEDATLTALKDVAGRVSESISLRKARMERILNESHFRSSNERFDNALAWAKLSINSLIMRQGKRGIFAGLPWFSNYWGRDTFISLPGATLVTGNFDDAREILESFAAWQMTDPTSPNEGRIPNLVTTTSTSYNTTDGTPWFTLGVFDYVKYSGDTAFARKMFPVLRLAIEGALRHRVDKEKFLTHGDAESWMDAVGQEGPWSPRGNRANDIQALWYRQLLVSTAFAEALGDRATAERWHAIAQELLYNFQERFVDPDSNIIYDHLNIDGTPDPSSRPNQLFALDIVAETDIRQRIFGTITKSLVYEHGVASLSQDDPKFHPYHHHEPYYVQDAAYHNGIVWTWLAGAWIKSAVEFGQPNLAYRVTENMVGQILERGAVGTLSELLDAAPHPGEIQPRLSGTFSQAWSLAEFIRVAYHSYLGVSVDAPNNQLWLIPQLPHRLNAATFDVAIGRTRVRISYEGEGMKGRIVVRSLKQDTPLSVNFGWPFANARGRSGSFLLRPGKTVDIALTEASANTTSDDPTINVESEVQFLSQFRALASLDLARPHVRPNLRSLKGPGYPLLSNNDIQRALHNGHTIVERSDPIGDDRGPGSFAYPTTPHLKPGSLDLTNFRVATDDSVVQFDFQFRTLSDPGWHPEYGFQLTYIAVAIDTDHKAGSGNRDIGHNARYRLPADRAYERIVYIGGGVRIEDRGSVLAEYLPVLGDEHRPLGTASTGTISFSLPTQYFGGRPDTWRFTVLVGAQDDHGGAGIGDFRSVEAQAGEWNGGGRRSPEDSNVYDVLVTQAEHAHKK